MQNASKYIYHLRTNRKNQMRDFAEMLQTIENRYGNVCGLVLKDWVGINKSNAEGLNFTDVQFKAMQKLLDTPMQVVSHSYAN